LVAIAGDSAAIHRVWAESTGVSIRLMFASFTLVS
jgi:hypothetical protein